MERAQTQLQRFIDESGLKAKDITDEASRISMAEGVESISRQHFLRLRQGRASATAERIYIIVAAVQSLTGMLIRATDLFVLQPATPGHGSSRWDGLHDLSAYRLPVSSRHRSSGSWKAIVTEDAHPADAHEFEALYIEYGVLLRSIAMRRYNVPPDDAEALVHDIFTAYLQRRKYVRELKPWLIGAIGNASKDYLRRRRREEPLLPEHDEIADRGAEEHAERCIVNMTAATVIARLGEKCRETLRSYYFREESKESIAQRLSTSPAYVLQLLVSCRRRVRAMYDSMRSDR
ncbi:MAG TPA: sigma-70 family RNA polymerase sigma factor [Thermoanaerobaculia bacterium]|nr:sigma-70 family RNA polymerase sigma factor [Thermoanaerobaculia bacterium]